MRPAYSFSAMKFLCPVTVAVCCAVSFTARVCAAEGFLLEGVNLVDVESGTVTADRSIRVEDGRIVAVSPSDGTPDPAAIDGGGAFVIPGLWDMHVHLTDAKEIVLPVLVANGVLGVRDMGGDLETLDRWRDAIVAGRRVGPRIVRSGPVVDGAKEGAPFRFTVETEEDGRRAARELKSRGVDFIKVHNGVPREAYFGLSDELRKVGLSYAGHVPFGVSVREATDAGQRSIEHVETILEGTFQEDMKARGVSFVKGLPYFLEHDARPLSERFVENGTWYTPMLVAYRSGAYRSDYEASDDPRLGYVARSLQDLWKARFPTRSKAVENVRRRFLETFKDFVALMRETGVPLLAGSDLGGSHIYPGFSLHDELGLLVEAGLTPREALETATLNPARFLELEEYPANFEEGSAADFVLLESNPLEDIARLGTIRAIVVRGRYLDREALDAMLAEVRDRAPSL